MNIPYVKQYNENGEVINKIRDKYISCNTDPKYKGFNSFPNRQQRRKAVTTRRNNNRKQHESRVQTIPYFKRDMKLVGTIIGQVKRILHIAQ